MSHPLGLEDVADAEVIEPSLMTVAQPMRAEARPNTLNLI